MILAIDVGNTNIVIGFLEKESIKDQFRLSTNTNETAEEYAIKLRSIMEISHISPEDLQGSIMATVVPSFIRTMSKAVKLVTGTEPLIVGPGIKTGLNIRINNPAEVGADMVVGAVAAVEKYSCPMIIFDLGTATTASVIDKNAAFIGGAIMCGAKTALNALSSGTAQLPQVDIIAPEKAISSNTIDCMRSGVVFGTAAMIDGLVKRFEKELGERASVVVTGGLGAVIAAYCETQVTVDRDLLLDGLRIIYDKNN